MAATRTAEIALRSEGVTVVRVHAGARQSLEDAEENLAGAIAACGGRKRPLLVDVSRCESLTPEVRHHYSGQTLTDSFCALAMLVEASPFGRMMGNLYFRVAKLGLPTKLFSDEERAIEWLLGYAVS